MLATSSGSELYSHLIFGVGEPLAAQGSVAVWPTSTTSVVVAGGAMFGNPGGTLSAVKKGERLEFVDT